jgi:hypothetical protein
MVPIVTCQSDPLYTSSTEEDDTLYSTFTSLSPFFPRRVHHRWPHYYYGWHFYHHCHQNAHVFSSASQCGLARLLLLGPASQPSGLLLSLSLAAPKARLPEIPDISASGACPHADLFVGEMLDPGDLGPRAESVFVLLASSQACILHAQYSPARCNKLCVIRT